ncbi:YCF48-related protein [Mucilaginibacter sp. RB4R14]|uniref:WD40/YVTN/BNR-like repeat-containing protein n=1 Tax=Mucilaginibacter aurantiaciroseus TaxID=2949308 RepID=UPI002091ADC8|nr:YCF48-related protein [Mucilaginibacter aurantiaciroseus]MCO5936137.1 YCF48-related protein [Mucilaginibacter aurantiaciroseus]
MRSKIILALATTLFCANLKAQTITPVKQSTTAGFRGLSVLNDKVAWVSGTKGTIGITTDGGANWTWQQVKDYDKADFRDIEALSDKEAVVIASGSPAYILKTTDGGLHWETKFKKADTTYFLDAINFTDAKHGFVLGDPINGKFLLLETLDGGDSWNPVKNAPVALKNEAAFAASGTCMRADGFLAIVTGGSNSRMLMSPIKDLVWVDKALPLTNGVSSRGAFSVAFGKNQTIIVGGNYAKDKLPDSVAYVIPGAGVKFKKNIPVIGPAGYQSCVEYLKDDKFLSTGTPGTNLTINGGKTWIKIDSTSYNVCRKAKRGNLILLAGDSGKLGIFKF